MALPVSKGVLYAVMWPAAALQFAMAASYALPCHVVFSRPPTMQTSFIVPGHNSIQLLMHVCLDTVHMLPPSVYPICVQQLKHVPNDMLTDCMSPRVGPPHLVL